MSPPQKLTTTEYAVLGLLTFGDASGYDLSRLASRSVGYMWAPSKSQTYKVLPRLVEWGLAESREVEQRGRPDKAIYRITDDGVAALRSWIEHVEDEPSGGVGIFALKLFLAGASSEEATLAQLSAYEGFLTRRLAAYEDMEAHLPDDEPVHSRILLRHGIVRTRATLGWVLDARRVLAEAYAPTNRAKR
jgi:PadR family transcriptional regulator, regulatory protein AphA